MDARQVGIKNDPTPAAVFGAGDGELCGLEPVGSARVDLGGRGATGLDGGDLHSRNPAGPTGVDLGGLGSTELDGGNIHPRNPFGPAGVDHGGLGSTGLAIVGGELSSRDPSGPAGVDHGGLGSTGHDGADLRSRDPSRPAGVDLAPNASGHVIGVDLQGRDDFRSSHQVAHPPGTGHGGSGTNPAPAFAPGGDDLQGRNPLGKPAHPIGAEGALVQDPAADFRPAGAGRGGGGRLHPPALLAILLGAMIIIAEPDAPWHRQLGAFLIFLIGCISLFLPRL